MFQRPRLSETTARVSPPIECITAQGKKGSRQYRYVVLDEVYENQVSSFYPFETLCRKAFP